MFQCNNISSAVRNIPYITQPFRQLKNSKKEGTETEKKEKEEINKVKAENIPLCKIVSEGAAKIRKLKINQKKVFKTC